MTDRPIRPLGKRDMLWLFKRFDPTMIDFNTLSLLRREGLVEVWQRAPSSDRGELVAAVVDW